MRNQAMVSVLAAGMMGWSTLAFAQQRVGPVYPQNPASAPPVGPDQGPQQARSGYDPFQYDPQTGRFNYVPIPYDQPAPGEAASPYRFNWYSSRWDYVPVPPAGWNDLSLNGNTSATDGAGGSASNYVDTQIDTSALPAAARIGPTPGPSPAPIPGAHPVPKAVPLPPPPSRARPIPPTRIPSTAPAPPSTRPSLDNPATPPRPSPPARPASSSQPARQSAAPSAMDARQSGEWITLNGLTGRWEYDYSRGKWVFVLPPG